MDRLKIRFFLVLPTVILGLVRRLLGGRTHALFAIFIVNPAIGDFLSSFFSTHPSTEKRPEELHQIEAKVGVL